jgi:hypothetical protein
MAHVADIINPVEILPSIRIVEILPMALDEVKRFSVGKTERWGNGVLASFLQFYTLFKRGCLCRLFDSEEKPRIGAKVKPHVTMFWSRDTGEIADVSKHVSH